MAPLAIVTREVLAGAYVSKGLASALSHAVEFDASGNEVRVLCGRVKVENLADSYASDESAKPTCATCARRDRR